MAFLDPQAGGEVGPGGIAAGFGAGAPIVGAARQAAKSRLGLTPNWQALIQGSPVYQSWLANKNAKLGNLATQRAGGVKSLVSKFGFLPPGFKDAFGDLTETDIAAGAANPFGVQAQIKKSYEDAVFNDRRALAARGMLQSGELGYAQNRETTARDQQTYQAGQEFMDALQQLLGGYATGAQEALGGEGDAIAQAQQFILAQGDPSPQADLVEGSMDSYGFPVYRDASGVLWRIDPDTGQPVQFQGGAAAPPPAAPPALAAPPPSPYDDPFRYGDIF